MKQKGEPPPKNTALMVLYLLYSLASQIQDPSLRLASGEIQDDKMVVLFYLLTGALDYN